jgi:hypothetical protein
MTISPLSGQSRRLTLPTSNLVITTLNKSHVSFQG